MKITSRYGTPIYVDERDDGALLISQGTSFIRVSGDEINTLIDALDQVSKRSV